MGHESRRNCCAVLFWTKTTLAVLIAVGFMAFMSQRVYTKHRDATKRKAAVPLNTPLQMVPVDAAGNQIGPAIPVGQPVNGVARRAYGAALEAELSGFRSFAVASS
ncbi:hypothetical protein HDU87_008407 [Geranomyces variabilis]|uniref:Uncharacterized protein n=1 Tax=Geranomyces variabilis TaxID=109894 RepID=A0AAD5TCX4_9FUNG|nr:hypothetical protein HDU87_008407 [Geranomyces variabilis]